MQALKSLALFFLVVLPIAGAVADDPKKPKPKPNIPTHNPEWTNPNTSDPGVKSTMDELQKIVVLCAKDYESAEFKRAWRAHVRKHKLKGAALQQTIQKVVNEAFEHRQEFGQTRGKQRLSSSWKSNAQKAMHDTSKSMIQNVRG